jgi:hypothetical protein
MGAVMPHREPYASWLLRYWPQITLIVGALVTVLKLSIAYSVAWDRMQSKIERLENAQRFYHGDFPTKP